MAESLLGFLDELAGGVAVAAGMTVVVGDAGMREEPGGTWTVRGRSASRLRSRRGGLPRPRGRRWMMTEAACLPKNRLGNLKRRW